MYTFNYQSGCENMQVDHLYGDKSNNFIDDCQWVTGKENVDRDMEFVSIKRTRILALLSGVPLPLSVKNLNTDHRDTSGRRR